jgi:hypothetical protein
MVAEYIAGPEAVVRWDYTARLAGDMTVFEEKLTG